MLKEAREKLMTFSTDEQKAQLKSRTGDKGKEPTKGDKPAKKDKDGAQPERK